MIANGFMEKPEDQVTKKSFQTGARLLSSTLLFSQLLTALFVLSHHSRPPPAGRDHGALQQDVQGGPGPHEGEGLRPGKLL